MEESIKNIHLVAQYLAAAGKSFLPNKDDDSQSNLGWNAKTNSLETRDLGHGYKLTFSLESAVLKWSGMAEGMDLKKHTHQEILIWLKETSSGFGFEKMYSYAVNYKLDYPEIEPKDSYSFDASEAALIAQKFTLTQKALDAFLKANELTSEIRVWPHHFDMGVYTKLSDKLFLGAGLAIPDSVESEFYFYASGWNDGQAINTKNLPKLSVGSWHAEWTGGTLKSNGVLLNDVIIFLNNAKDAYIENK